VLELDIENIPVNYTAMSHAVKIHKEKTLTGGHGFISRADLKLVEICSVVVAFVARR
jgi:hypothetical protein